MIARDPNSEENDGPNCVSRPSFHATFVSVGYVVSATYSQKCGPVDERMPRSTLADPGVPTGLGNSGYAGPLIQFIQLAVVLPAQRCT